MNNNKEKYDNNGAHIIEKVAQGVKNKITMIVDDYCVLFFCHVK